MEPLFKKQRTGRWTSRSPSFSHSHSHTHLHVRHMDTTVARHAHQTPSQLNDTDEAVPQARLVTPSIEHARDTTINKPPQPLHSKLLSKTMIRTRNRSHLSAPLVARFAQGEPLSGASVPAAVAAAAARTSALAAQELAAAEDNSFVPGKHGPAPAIIPSQVSQSLAQKSNSNRGASSFTSAISSASRSPAEIQNSGFPATQSTADATPTLGNNRFNTSTAILSALSTDAADSSFISERSNQSPTPVSQSMAVSFQTSLTSTIISSSVNLPIITDAALFTPVLGESTVPPSVSQSANAVTTAIVNATTTESNKSNNSADSRDRPSAKVLAGGVIGGIAGAAFILAALLILLRWRRARKTSQKHMKSLDKHASTQRDLTSDVTPMSQKRNTRFSAYMIPNAFSKKRAPSSAYSIKQHDATENSDRGFEKLGGRKLPSILHSGGDGYGSQVARPHATSSQELLPQNSIPISNDHNTNISSGLKPPITSRGLSGSSFYQDSNGFYGGIVRNSVASAETQLDEPSTGYASTSFQPTLTAEAPFASAGSPPGASDHPFPNVREGPARQPVLQSGYFLSKNAIPPSAGAIQSHSGSTSPSMETPPSSTNPRIIHSRFTESTTPP